MNIPMGSGTMKSLFDRFALKVTFNVKKVKNEPFHMKIINMLISHESLI